VRGKITSLLLGSNCLEELAKLCTTALLAATLWNFPAGPYNPTDSEKTLYAEWLARGVFTADPTSSKPH